MLSTREIDNPTQVAIACQGGGSHAIFNAGVLKVLVKEQTDQRYRIMGLSGTSGGGICALLTWYALLESGEGAVGPRLDAFWRDNAPEYPWEYLWNAWSVLAASAPLDARVSPYAPPLSWVEAGLGLWAPRKEFVDLRCLLEKHVRTGVREGRGDRARTRQSARSAHGGGRRDLTWPAHLRNRKVRT
jgi:NTE family protein